MESVSEAFKITNPYALKTWDEWNSAIAELNDLSKKICEGFCDPCQISFFKDDEASGLYQCRYQRVNGKTHGSHSISLMDVDHAFIHELAHHFQYFVFFDGDGGHDHIFAGAFGFVVNIIITRGLSRRIPIPDDEYILKEHVERQNLIPSNEERPLQPGWETPFRMIRRTATTDVEEAKDAMQCPTPSQFFEIRRKKEKAERESKSHWLIKAGRLCWREKWIPLNIFVILFFVYVYVFF